MHCPDCGQVITEVTVTGFDKSWRCENCGGFLVAGWVANRVTEGQMKEISEVKADLEKFVGKTNQCPMDGSPLFGYSGEDMPPEVPVLKCSHCGQWWFPGDTLFKFKKAYEAKTNYEKMWKRRAPLMVMALPVMMVLALLLTMGIVVRNINSKQEVGTQASIGEEFNAQYQGEGRELIRFKTEKVDMVWYRKVGEDVWGPVEISVVGQGWYRAILTNIDEKSVYQILIADKKYYFRAH